MIVTIVATAFGTVGASSHVAATVDLMLEPVAIAARLTRLRAVDRFCFVRSGDAVAPLCA